MMSELMAHSRTTLWNPMDCSLPGFPVHGIFQARVTGVGCHCLLQGIFPTQGSNPCLLHCRQMLYRLSHQSKTVPAHNHELLLRCPRSEMVPEVHGEDGAGTVKDGGEGRRERCHHHSHHEPAEPWGQKGALWALGFFCLHCWPHCPGLQPIGPERPNTEKAERRAGSREGGHRGGWGTAPCVARA